MRVEKKLAIEGLELLESSVRLLLETNEQGLTNAQIEHALELYSVNEKGDWQGMISQGVLNRLICRGLVRREGYVYKSNRKKGESI